MYQPKNTLTLKLNQKAKKWQERLENKDTLTDITDERIDYEALKLKLTRIRARSKHFATTN